MLAAADRSRPTRRPGLGGVELIVIIVIVGFLVCCVLIVLPRGRETSRMAGCQRNLMQIGVGTLLYHQAARHYPLIPRPDGSGAGEAPIGAMLKALTLPDFLDLHDPAVAPKPGEAPARGTRVAGLICPSDPTATSTRIATALSYRANVGSDTIGSDGPFAFGTAVTAERVEAADGLSFTAGFAERLTGTGRDEPGQSNYALVPGPVAVPCDPVATPGPHWRGDAGSSWADPGWRSAPYSHAGVPDAPASCIADDGRTATMGASSAHPGRINVWMLDGSLRGVKPSIDPPVWRAMGSIGSIPGPVQPPR